MNRSFPFFILFFLLNSCSTIINSPFQKVNINQDPGLSVRVDTSKFSYRKAEIYNGYVPKDYKRLSMYFLRCKYDIPLIINEYDTLKLKPHRSYFSFWFANLYLTSGIGMLVDYPNDKSYEYPIYIYIAKVNNVYRNIRFKPYQEKSLHFTLSIPSVNMFHLQTGSGKSNTASALGISGQLEYFLKNNIYLSLSAGITMDLFTAQKDTVKDNYFKEYNFGFSSYSSSEYLDLRINKATPRFEYGLGLTLSALKWRENNRIDVTDSTHTFGQVSMKSLNLGLSSAVAFRMTPNFNIGCIYQPLFFDFIRKKSNYQHFITFQLMYRF